MNPSEVDFVIYHGGCVDGFGAAWAAWKLLGDKATYFPAYHNAPPPNVTGKNVAILDFAYSENVTKDLSEQAKSIVILDHHISNKDALSNFDFAIFDMSRSGAMMSWEFFHSKKSPPLLIQYIQDRDLWKWQLPNSREFSAGFHETSFSFDEYDKYLKTSEIDRAIIRGSHILKHMDEVIKNISKDACDRTLFETYKCKVVNSSAYRSEVGNFLASQCDGIGVVWFFNHKTQSVQISFRSNDEKNDVAKICKLLKNAGFAFNETTNVGGHSKAAGFVMSSKYTIEDIFSLDKSHLMNSDV